MISKILSILKKQKEKEKPHIVQERYDFLEDVCAEFLIQVNVEGDFVISFNARESDMEAVPSVGNLIFLISEFYQKLCLNFHKKSLFLIY